MVISIHAGVVNSSVIMYGMPDRCSVLSVRYPISVVIISIIIIIVAVFISFFINTFTHPMVIVISILFSIIFLRVFFMSDDMVEICIPFELVNGVVVRIVEDFIS